MGLNLGIDATNLRQGGGRTHLIELLHAADPSNYRFARVVIWGAKSTLDLLPNRDWLIKSNPSAQEGGLLARSAWQRFALSQAARAEGCHLLFVPGGSFMGNFRPFVTMSQNMLPFEWREIQRYGASLLTVKLLLRLWTQSRSFKKADGTIFLTRYAHTGVLRITGRLSGISRVIPHGLNPRFFQTPKPQRPVESYLASQPFRIVYVSIINYYKHQWLVIEAVGALREKTGWPLALDLVGPGYPPALARMVSTMAVWDPKGSWVNYHRNVPYSELHAIYQQADIGVFASSCENMPNILLETMAAGLPVACSDRGPMPEVLGDAGVYFDPENSSEIAGALEQLIGNPALRSQLAARSFTVAQRFDWRQCADQTFDFLSEVYDQYERKRLVCAG